MITTVLWRDLISIALVDLLFILKSNRDLILWWVNEWLPSTFSLEGKVVLLLDVCMFLVFQISYKILLRNCCQ